MRIISVFLLLFVFNVSFSQSPTYAKSEIVDNIPVKGRESETFAIYLPDAYNVNELSAIVFIFDPAGRGAHGIKPFISSAERFNYILICSNNTKNGPYQDNFDYTNRLFSYVFSNFKIDEKQIYTAGFSGGSRLACAVAVLTDAIQGVIACGAGFPNEMDKKPNLESKFSYVGLVGDEDMNYQEMLLAREWLNKFTIDNELFTYEDGHSWPPSNQIERAFKWLELQAYNKKLRKLDADNVQTFYQEELAIADSLSNTQVFNSIKEYERLKRNHSLNKNIEVISQKMKILKNSKKYNQEVKIRNSIALKEEKLSNKYMLRLNQEASYGESRDNFAWWKKEFKRLDEDYLKSDDYSLKKLGKRVQFRVKAAAFESSKFERNGRRIDKAIYCDKLLTKLYPKEPYWFYRLAETYAINNDAKNSRINLEYALDIGFNQYQQILGNPLFGKFKSDKKFSTFLENLKAN